jgi:predicted DsbA family dithiol-disulfide isomerase
MVIQSTEEHAVEKKEAVVTSEVFTELAKSVGMDPEVMERFRSGG